MTEEEILNIVAQGEGYNAEFKESIPSRLRDIAEEICAFANSSGGVLIIGVNDSNQIVGVTYDNNRLSRIQDAINGINPSLRVPIETKLVRGDNIIYIEVPTGSQKPYILSGAIYIRIGPNTQKLTSPEEIRGFFQQSGRVYFDQSPCQDFVYEDHFSDDAFNEFLQISGLTSTLSQELILRNLKLYFDDRYFKNGAVLMFGKNPDEFFDKAVIRCLLFRDIDKRFIEDDKIFKGTLYKQYIQSISWLKNKLKVSYDIEGQGSEPRKEKWEISEVVFKEVIINALSHRDYYEQGARITIEVFTDRVEITNPGGLISSLPESEFGKRSMTRNPLIFGLFERMRLVEQIGSGIPRVRQLMREYNLPEPEFNYNGIFVVTLYRPVNIDKLIEKEKNNLSDKQIQLLQLVHEKPSITISDLSTQIGISTTAIDKNIKKLKELNILKRVGSDKEGNWIVVGR